MISHHILMSKGLSESTALNLIISVFILQMYATSQSAGLTAIIPSAREERGVIRGIGTGLSKSARQRHPRPFTQWDTAVLRSLPLRMWAALPREHTSCCLFLFQFCFCFNCEPTSLIRVAYRNKGAEGLLTEACSYRTEENVSPSPRNHELSVASWERVSPSPILYKSSRTHIWIDLRGVGPALGGSLPDVLCGSYPTQE